MRVNFMLELASQGYFKLYSHIIREQINIRFKNYCPESNDIFDTSSFIISIFIKVKG